MVVASRLGRLRISGVHNARLVQLARFAFEMCPFCELTSACGASSERTVERSEWSVIEQ
jgi:hypothetical protein